MLKKVSIIFVCIVFFVTPNINFMQTAKANSFADIPGYTDELFEGLMTSAMVVAGGAAHAQETINDNLDLIKTTARNLWNTYSPQAKELFKQSLTLTADGIVVAGDAITSFLDSLAPNFKDTSNTSGTIYSGGLTITKLNNAKTFTIDKNDGKTVSIGGATNFTIGFYEYSSTGEFYVRGGYNQTAEVNKEIFNSLKAQLEGVSSVASLARLLQRINDYGGYSRVITINNGGTLINDFDAPVDPIYNQADRWLRDRAAAGGLSLGLPRSVPYSNTGRPLEVGGTGVLIDGVPYTGAISWKDTVLGVPGSKEGIANLPLLYLDGKPLHWVTTSDGQTQLVTSDGNIVTDLTNVQTVPNEIINVDGVPYTFTPTGALINIRTGEIVTDGSAIGAPTIPGIKPVVPPVTDFGSPTSGLNFQPLLMNARILTEKFPFSIPWDVMRQLSVFNVEPTTPVFKIDIKDYLTIGSHTIPMKFDIDLEMFDVVANIIRWFNIIIWDIGLLLAIRKFMPE